MVTIVQQIRRSPTSIHVRQEPLITGLVNKAIYLAELVLKVNIVKIMACHGQLDCAVRDGTATEVQQQVRP